MMILEFIVDHDLHIHSKLSLCSSDPEQNNERILQYAKENNLKTICITDHFWDYPNVECEQDWYRKQNFVNIKSIFERAIKLLELTEDNKWHIG